MAKLTGQALEDALEKEFSDRNWSDNFDLVPPETGSDAPINVMVATGDPDLPLIADQAWWNDEMGRWDGAWRNTEGDGAYPHAEPVLWCLLPDLDDEWIEKFNVPIEEAAA